MSRSTVVVLSVLLTVSSACASSRLQDDGDSLTRVGPIETEASSSTSAPPVSLSSSEAKTTAPPTEETTPLTVAIDWIAGKYESASSHDLAQLVDPLTLGAVEAGDGYFGIGDHPTTDEVQPVASEDGLRWQQRPAPTGLPTSSVGPYRLWPLHGEMLLAGRDLVLDGSISGRAGRTYFATSVDGQRWKVLDIELDVSESLQGRLLGDLDRNVTVARGGGLAAFAGIHYDESTGNSETRVYRYVAGSLDAELIHTEAGRQPFEISSVESDVLLSIAAIDTQIATTQLLSTGALVFEQDLASVSDTRSIGGNLIVRLNSRYEVSRDFGLSYVEFDGPKNSTWLLGRWSSFGAVGPVEPSFGAAEFIEVSGNGVDWARLEIPPNTAEIVPLSFGDRGMLALLLLKQAEGELLIRVPWP